MVGRSMFNFPSLKLWFGYIGQLFIYFRCSAYLVGIVVNYLWIVHSHWIASGQATQHITSNFQRHVWIKSGISFCCTRIYEYGRRERERENAIWRIYQFDLMTIFKTQISFLITSFMCICMCSMHMHAPKLLFACENSTWCHPLEDKEFVFGLRSLCKIK